jgi:Spy/CpxP family protein refolding chaperone
MRKSRVLALVVASLVSTASFAGAQAPAAGAHGGRHAMGPGMEGRRGGALRGLKLSDAEKAKLKEIHTKYAAEGKTLRESMKPVMQEARTLRQKGDTAGLRALWDKNKAGRDQMQALQVRQQADIRAALSPDNQKLFDANVQKQAQRRAEWKKDGKAGGRGGRRGAAKVG